MDEPELGRDLYPGPDDGVSGLDRLGGDLVADEAYADPGFDEVVDHRFAVGFDDSRRRGGCRRGIDPSRGDDESSAPAPRSMVVARRFPTMRATAWEPKEREC